MARLFEPPPSFPHREVPKSTVECLLCPDEDLATLIDADEAGLLEIRADARTGSETAWIYPTDRFVILPLQRLRDLLRAYDERRTRIEGR